MPDSSEDYQESPPRRHISLYQCFMDWLWFGPLTRDLRPRRTPSTLSQVFSLLRYICQDTWSLIQRYAGRSQRPGE
jgi:hypothetical protein